ncbi:retrovirus-related pol polyprotein from transposon TNT 1-94, partial [Tanacetum coccineum]
MRYGHLNFGDLKLLSSKGMVKGLDQIDHPNQVCEGCLLGKHARSLFPKEATSRAKEPLQIIHTDLCGPITPPSNGKNLYFMLFIDDYSRKAWVYFLKEKSQAFEAFKKFKAMVEKEKGLNIKSMRSDRGGKFLSKEFKKFCEDNGIQRFLTTLYSPQQNGVVERKNITILNMVQSMLKSKKMPKEFLAEAVNCAVVMSRDVEFEEEGSWDWSIEEHERYDFLPITDEDERGELVFEHAIKSKKWRQAMEEQIKSIEKNDMWELTTFQKAKRLLELSGYTRQDLWQKVTSRSMVSTTKRWKIHQIDVKSAFLNGLLEEEVYVEQPKGYVAKGQEGKVLKLKKALYGQKQAPRAWNTRIDKYFQGHGLAKCLSEYALYMKFEYKSILLACLYVDDLIFTRNSQSMIDKLKNSMMREFEMTYIGLMSYYQGIEVKQMDDGIFIYQERYAKEILKRFGMDKCNPVGSPLKHKAKPSKHDRGKKVDSTLFKSLIRSLHFLTCTRPDILFAVGLIIRFIEDPTTKHLKIAK